MCSFDGEKKREISSGLVIETLIVHCYFRDGIFNVRKDNENRFNRIEAISLWEDIFCIVNNWFSLDTIGKLWIFLYLISSVSP